MKPTKCSTKEKELRQEKGKQSGGEKAKSKNQDACVTCKSEILLSGSEGRKVYELLMAVW